MKIQEFSQLIGLTSDTLRYYEKEGLVKPVRDASGHRDYSEQDIEWVKMILRLKETRMPIEKIKRYAELRYLGDKTFEERYHLLLAHQKELATLQDRLMSYQVYLQHKIAFYQDKLK